MADLIICEREDIVAIANATRSVSGTIDKMTLGEIASTINELDLNGVGSALVKYVTFMNGDVELFKMPVLSGDDCKDPIEHGDMNTPTKESTNTTNYTHSGWSMTNGGSADASALKNVTEDRVVYATFTSSVRYYTVNFYDGNELLNTMQVTYNGTANYIAQKAGYGFVGWQPSNENIIADTDCYAQWSELVTFANASWWDIARISESGEASNYFAIGDTKEVSIGTATVTVQIADFNHDDLSDGSGKAGITIVCKTLPNGSVSTEPYWNNCYQNTENTYWNELPESLRNVIKTVTKKCDSNNSYTSNPTLLDLDFKLFLLSVDEINGRGLFKSSATNNYSKISTLGTKYPVYDGTTETTIQRGDYCLRQNCRCGVDSMCFVNTSGKIDTINVSTYYGMALFGFCV